MMQLQRLLMILLMTVMVPSAIANAQQSHNTLTEQERADGWQLLFDGESIEEHFRGFKTEDVPDCWSIEDDCITPRGGGPELLTKKTWRDFEFTCQWKVEPGGNSGIMYHVGENGRYAWETGLEMQILDNQKHPDGRNPLTSAASCYAMYPPTKDATNPVGEFNTARIVVKGQNVEHWLNGELVCAFERNSDDWNERFETSKFKRNGWLDYAQRPKGHITLQAHGERVWFRNIKIKPLNKLDGQILVFTSTKGFRHRSIEHGVEVVQMLASENNLGVSHIEDARWFETKLLNIFDVVVFLNTTGDVLNDEQQAAFEKYIRNGGGYVGIHSASDTEFDWPWYGELVGAYFKDHPRIQDARVEVEDQTHPATEHLPRGWLRNDEWYNYRAKPADHVTVLMRLDTTSYEGDNMDGDHPIAWCHDYDGGRSFYTGGGHRIENFDEPLFRQHLLGGILWAAGIKPWAGPVKEAQPEGGSNSNE